MHAPAIPTAIEYEAARERHLKFAADLTGAQALVVRLRGTRQGYDDRGGLRWLGGDLEAARLADDQAQGAALLSGSKPAARSNEARVAKELVDADQRIGALTMAVIAADAAVTEWLTGRTEELVVAVEAFVGVEGAEYGAAIEALEAARARFWATRALSGWLADTTRRFKPVLPGLKVEGLVQANGEPTRLEPILEALRDEVTQAEQQERPVTMRWRKEVVFGDSADGQRGRVIEERFVPIQVFADGSEREVGA